MIKIFLSINNNEKVIQLPVPPEDYEVPSPWKNEQSDGMQGSLNRIGRRGLKSIQIKSFFPERGHDYPFLQNRSMWGMDYVEEIERWRARRLPLRLIIVGGGGKKNVNMAVTLDEFDHGIGKSGDIDFSMKMTEFPMPSTRR